MEVTYNIVKNGTIEVTYKEYYAPNLGKIYSESSDGFILDLTSYSSNLEIDKSINEGNKNINNDRSKDTEVLNNSPNGLSYSNEEYNFSIRLPKQWSKKYKVSEENWVSEAEKSIDFFYTKNNENYGNIFSILIVKGNITKSQWNNPMWIYIDTKNGITFAYSVAGNPSEILLDGKHENELKEIQKMINEDLPGIIETFTFN